MRKAYIPLAALEADLSIREEITATAVELFATLVKLKLVKSSNDKYIYTAAWNRAWFLMGTR